MVDKIILLDIFMRLNHVAFIFNAMIAGVALAKNDNPGFALFSMLSLASGLIAGSAKTKIEKLKEKP